MQLDQPVWSTLFLGRSLIVYLCSRKSYIYVLLCSNRKNEGIITVRCAYIPNPYSSKSIGLTVCVVCVMRNLDNLVIGIMRTRTALTVAPRLEDQLNI